MNIPDNPYRAATPGDLPGDYGEEWDDTPTPVVPECEFCHGTGLRSVTIHREGFSDIDADEQPCGFCQ